MLLVNSGTQSALFALTAVRHLEIITFIWRMVYLIVKKIGMSCLLLSVLVAVFLSKLVTAGLKPSIAIITRSVSNARSAIRI